MEDTTINTNVSENEATGAVATEEVKTYSQEEVLALLIYYIVFLN